MRWETFHERIREEFKPADLLDIERNFAVMFDTHDGERRDGGRPYRYHPIGAFFLAFSLGERDTEVLCAILSHDVLESAKKLNKPLTLHDLKEKVGSATANRVSLMTKEGHTDRARAKSWKRFRECGDPKTYKAKSYERLDNVKTFKNMKAKPGETRRARSKRKVDETVREFSPIVAWLEADVDTRSFPSARARNAERELIANLRLAFNKALAKYGAKLA